MINMKKLLTKILQALGNTVSKTGDTMTGDLQITRDGITSCVRVTSLNGNTTVADGQLSANTSGNFGLYDQIHDKWLIRSNKSAKEILFGMPLHISTIYNTKLTAPSAQNTWAEASVPNIANYNIILMRCECFNCRQLLVFCRNFGTGALYLTDNASTYVRGGYRIDWTNNKVGVQWLNGTTTTASTVYIQQVYGIV